MRKVATSYLCMIPAQPTHFLILFDRSPCCLISQIPMLFLAFACQSLTLYHNCDLFIFYSTASPAFASFAAYFASFPMFYNFDHRLLHDVLLHVLHPDFILHINILHEILCFMFFLLHLLNLSACLFIV